MDDTKISELPVATAIASPDVAPIVQGGVTKQADVSLFGGSAFLSADIARVDPSGNDGTGTVGDLNKPFLTVQAAINAIQAGSFTNPVIDTGANDFSEDLTTSLTQLAFQGTGQTGSGRSIFNSLTSTEATNPVNLIFNDVRTGTITASSPPGTNLYLNNAITDDITSTGVVNVFGDGLSSKVLGTISAPGNIIQAYRVFVNRINSAGSALSLDQGTILNLLSAAASVVLQDSRIETNTPALIPIHADLLLNPVGTDFSTLPQQTDDSGLSAGQGWIDTTAGLNIVKVKL